MSQNKTVNDYGLQTIFYVQIGLLCLLALTFLIGVVFPRLNMGSFFFAVIMGALGSSISLLRRVRLQDNALEKEYKSIKKFAVLMPVLYGTLLSGIAYLCFMSGILSGEGGSGIITTNLFPNFTDAVSESNVLQQFIETQPSQIQDTGKLLVWCFIAGYSEKFIIGIISQLESKGTV